jgi:hypothetical protein
MILIRCAPHVEISDAAPHPRSPGWQKLFCQRSIRTLAARLICESINNFSDMSDGRSVMSHLKRKSQRTINDLERVIEPLASYICAADHPKAVLRRALTVLCSEVQHTNRIAHARLTARANSQWS